MAHRILVVDDMPSNLRLLATILSDRYQVSVASSGREALALLERITPDLIILDVEMPGMSGLDLCRTLKDIAEYRHIPVIFLTGRSDEANEVLGLQLGAVDYITKPFNKAIVRARIHTQIELKRYSDLLQQHAFLDGLTGLPNRRRLDQFLAECWTSPGVNANDPISAIMIDVDYFKAYNDHYGHQTGDHCLREIATTLSQARRRTNDLLARYGGEEFVLVMPGASGENARSQADRLQSAIESANIPHSGLSETCRVTISIGVATLVLGQCTSKELIAKADDAVYEAKKGGRNRVVQA